MSLPRNDMYFHEMVFIALGMLFSLCSTMICVSEFFFLISGNNNALTLACLWAPVAAVSCILYTSAAFILPIDFYYELIFAPITAISDLSHGYPHMVYSLVSTHRGYQGRSRSSWGG